MATHRVDITDERVVKEFRSWHRGEHEREWSVLTLLHRHAPGLVPVPVGAALDADPPTVTMSRVPGVPLEGRLTGGQFDALAVALRHLWSVPVGDLPPRRYRPREVVDLVLRDFAAWPSRDGVVGSATTAALGFLRRHRVAAGGPAVVGHSDPNLANYLWDGSRVRIVDFEDAGRSDVAYELATLAEHITARGTDWEPFLARFDVDPAGLLAGRRLTAVLWLHTLLLIGSAGRDVAPENLGRQADRVLTLLT